MKTLRKGMYGNENKSMNEREREGRSKERDDLNENEVDAEVAKQN
jgi:hypothetical protein